MKQSVKVQMYWQVGSNRQNASRSELSVAQIPRWGLPWFHPKELVPHITVFPRTKTTLEMSVNPTRSWESNCPVPIQHPEKRVTLAHGEGGRLMRQLLADHIFSGLGTAALRSDEDAAR